MWVEVLVAKMSPIFVLLLCPNAQDLPCLEGKGRLRGKGEGTGPWQLPSRVWGSHTLSLMHTGRGEPISLQPHPSLDAFLGPSGQCL